MKKREEIQQELETLSPLLAKMKRQEELEVPAHYFDRLTDTVLEEVRPNVEIEPSKTSVFDEVIAFFQNLIQPRKAVALASLLLLVAAYFVMNPNNGAINNSAVAELTSEDLQNYIADNIDDFEEETLYLLSENADLSVDFLEDIEAADLDAILENVLDDVEVEDLL